MTSLQTNGRCYCLFTRKETESAKNGVSSLVHLAKTALFLPAHPRCRVHVCAHVRVCIWSGVFLLLFCFGVVAVACRWVSAVYLVGYEDQMELKLDDSHLSHTLPSNLTPTLLRPICHQRGVIQKFVGIQN